MPWHGGSITAKHLVFGRADEFFDFEGDDAVNEQLLDRLFAEDVLRPRCLGSSTHGTDASDGVLAEWTYDFNAGQVTANSY